MLEIAGCQWHVGPVSDKNKAFIGRNRLTRIGKYKVKCSVWFRCDRLYHSYASFVVTALAFSSRVQLVELKCAQREASSMWQKKLEVSPQPNPHPKLHRSDKLPQGGMHWGEWLTNNGIVLGHVLDTSHCSSNGGQLWSIVICHITFAHSTFLFYEIFHIIILTVHEHQPSTGHPPAFATSAQTILSTHATAYWHVLVSQACQSTRLLLHHSRTLTWPKRTLFFTTTFN